MKRLHVVPVAAIQKNLWELKKQYCLWYLGVQNGDRSIIFLDEVGFCVTMRTSRGRAKSGKKAILTGPAIKSRNITVIAAVCKKQLLYYEILPGPGNTERFLHFIVNLANERDNAELPGDSIIIMDNVAIHKHRDVIEMMEIRGFTHKFLPAYSKFLNPIECLFSQWKSDVKKISSDM